MWSKSGQDEVDAGLVVLGEQHAAVDDEQAAAVLEHGHVAADLAEAAERDDAQGALGEGGRRAELGVRLGHRGLLGSVREQARGPHRGADDVDLVVVGGRPAAAAWCGRG